jgi:hypothetical protein
MELMIDTIGKEDDAIQLLAEAGFAVRMDPDVPNVFHLDDSADMARVGEVLDAAQIEYQWMELEFEEEADDDEVVD